MDKKEKQGLVGFILMAIILGQIMYSLGWGIWYRLFGLFAYFYGFYLYVFGDDPFFNWITKDKITFVSFCTMCFMIFITLVYCYGKLQ